MIAALGLVVCSSSKHSSSRARSIRSPRARMIEPWVNAVRFLCVEVTMPSAPRAIACAGRSGWKPRWAPQAWSTISGTPAAWLSAAIASMSESPPT